MTPTELASAIAGRLFIDGARDVSDAELTRVLGRFGLAGSAIKLREMGMLTLAEEWINRRHYHAAGDDRGACMCDTPEVDRVRKRAYLVACGQPDRPRAGCGKTFDNADGIGTLELYADTIVTLCPDCATEGPF